MSRSIQKMNNVFLKAAEHQHNYWEQHKFSKYSCFTISDANIDPDLRREKEFYRDLYECAHEPFNTKLGKLQKKRWDKVSEKRINEIRVLALLFAHHIYNDTERL